MFAISWRRATVSEFMASRVCETACASSRPCAAARAFSKLSSWCTAATFCCSSSKAVSCTARSSYIMAFKCCSSCESEVSWTKAILAIASSRVLTSVSICRWINNNLSSRVAPSACWVCRMSMRPSFSTRSSWSRRSDIVGSDLSRASRRLTMASLSSRAATRASPMTECSCSRWPESCVNSACRMLDSSCTSRRASSTRPCMSETRCALVSRSARSMSSTRPICLASSSVSLARARRSSPSNLRQRFSNSWVTASRLCWSRARVVSRLRDSSATAPRARNSDISPSCRASCTAARMSTELCRPSLARCSTRCSRSSAQLCSSRMQRWLSAMCPWRSRRSSSRRRRASVSEARRSRPSARSAPASRWSSSSTRRLSCRTSPVLWLAPSRIRCRRLSTSSRRSRSSRWAWGSSPAGAGGED
mmetsp:Transcript_2975/g.11423  ORF Transcript_2975/g.11423 Transcript_2975/m.11423 type:complete len:420 (-) Transcript_2975:391-1650(-)